MNKYCQILLLTLVCMSCSTGEEKADVQDARSSENSADSLAVSQSNIQNADNPEHSSFTARLAAANDSLQSWGYKAPLERVLTTRDDFFRHWWLKFFNRRNAKYLKYYPDSSDYGQIDRIRQLEFVRGWSFFIEEWTFKDRHSALNWLEIAASTKDIDNFKPPRAYWTQDNKMYFVMATAAADWEEHGQQLIQLISGKPRFLLELLNRPLDFQAYKMIKGTSNSGGIHFLPYFIKPEERGFYYRYMLFPIHGYSEGESFEGLQFITYKFDSTIGDYFDDNEILIEIKSRLKDPQLQGANLVGLSRENLMDFYGISPATDLFSTSQNGYVLILHFVEDTVDWYKYARTDLPDSLLSVDNLPDELLQFR